MKGFLARWRTDHRPSYVAFLVGIGMSLVALSLFVSDVARADYHGARWRDTTVCVQNRVHDPVIRQSVAEAVKFYRDNTDLHIVNYGSSVCKGRYDQIVYAVDNYYGKGGWNGTTYYGGFDWGHTDDGWWTWFLRSGVQVRFNQSYPNNEHGWEHITAHELGHALGLGEERDHCKSVMAWECPWLDRPASPDYRELDVIYSR